jgi:hypothetical protein
MRKCSPELIIKEVPNVQSVVMPRDWFDDLNYNKSVFQSLYEWMLKDGLVPSENKESLHDRTYVGDRLYKKLLAAEKKRIKKRHKLTGEELERSVCWSEMNGVKP